MNPDGWTNGNNSVTAGRARQHLEWLAEHDVGLTTVAHYTGIARSTLLAIVSGRCDDCGRTRRIKVKVESKILGCRPAQGLPTERIPATPTYQNVEELIAHGWSRRQIAEAIGQKDRPIRLGQKTVTRGTARAVQSLIDRHVSPPPKRHAYPADRNERELYLEVRPIPDDMNLDWFQHAACKQVDKPLDERTRMFFPARGDAIGLKAAKAICATCPVRQPCLQLGDAIADGGVWGGLSEDERHRRLGRRGGPLRKPPVLPAGVA